MLDGFMPDKYCLVLILEQRIMQALDSQRALISIGNVQPADDQIFLCQKSANAANLVRHRRRGRNIPAADVLSQKLSDRRNDLSVIQPIHMLYGIKSAFPDPNDSKDSLLRLEAFDHLAHWPGDPLPVCEKWTLRSNKRRMSMLQVLISMAKRTARNACSCDMPSAYTLACIEWIDMFFPILIHLRDYGHCSYSANRMLKRCDAPQSAKDQ